MSNKFSQWFKAVREQSSHGSIATRATTARVNLIGKNTLVEKHLRKISEREEVLSQFAGIIANSPALNDEDEQV